MAHTTPDLNPRGFQLIQPGAPLRNYIDTVGMLRCRPSGNSDSVSPGRRNDDAEDTPLDTDFAKLHFAMISKAEDEITPDDIEIGTSYDVADIALENSPDNNGVIEASFQIPDTIEESGTYILLSYAETPSKPLEDATVVSNDLSSQEDVITTQSLKVF